MEHWMPDQVFGRLKKIPRAQWCAFAGVWLAGLFAHGYMLANKLPNHDDLHSLFGKGGTYASGRWGLVLVGKLDGNYSAPWMLGFFTLFLLSVSAMLIAALLRIKTPLPGALAGCIIAVFPTLTCIFAYMFTSFAYAVSILLAVLAAWLCRKKSRLWLVPAAVCIMFSLSIYQAFFGWTTALLVYGLYADSVREDAAAKEIFVSGVWQAGTLAAGMALYLGVTRRILAVREVTLTSYMKMDQMGEIHPSLIPGQILEAYRMFFSRWQKSALGITTTAGIRRLLTVCALLLAAALLAGVARQLVRKKWPEAALAAGMALLFPVAVNIVCLMNSSSIHTLMVYPMCMVPLALLAQCESWTEPPLPKSRAALGRVLGSWAVVGCVGLLALRYGMLANEAYLQMQLNQTRRISYWTGIVTQIRSLPDYDPSLPVALVGEDSEDPNLTSMWRGSNLEGMVGVSVPIRQVSSDQDLLRYYLGYSPDYANDYEMWEHPEVQAMPSYPEKGSIAVVDGVIVVKIGDF